MIDEQFAQNFAQSWVKIPLSRKKSGALITIRHIRGALRAFALRALLVSMTMYWHPSILYVAGVAVPA
jgi:hypothetical protein